MNQVRERATQLLSVVILLAAWQALAVELNSTALPPASETFATLWALIIDRETLGPLLSTLSRAIFGFLIGFIMGIAYGIVMYTVPRIREMLGELFDLVMFTPTLIFIFVGLSMVGYDNALAVVIIVALVVSPIVAIYVRDALGGLDDNIILMASSFKVGKSQRVRDIYLPFLIPALLGAARITFSTAAQVTFLCEAFGFPEGLGWEVRINYTIYDMPSLLAWLGVFIITVLVVEQFIRIGERALVRWY